MQIPRTTTASVRRHVRLRRVRRLRRHAADQHGLPGPARPVPVHVLRRGSAVALIVGEQFWRGADWLHAMLYSASGDVTGVVQSVKLTPDGRLINTGGCDPAEWSDFVAGHIALIESGPCLRRDQVLNAQNAGAIGLISLYPNWTQGRRAADAARSAGRQDSGRRSHRRASQALLAAAAAGATVELNSQVTTRSTTNDTSSPSGRARPTRS